MLKFGDRVKLQNTFEWEIGGVKPVGDTWNGKTGTIIKGPFYEEQTGSIDVYLVRLDAGTVEGREEAFNIKAIWSALHYIGEDPDKEYLEAQIKWEKAFDGD